MKALSMDAPDRTADSLRKALRGVASTVTIISTEVAHHRFGMVATAVMPVSMEPPTLAIGVNRTASIHDRLQERGSFAVNILSRWNHAMVRGFASASGEARFAHGVWSSHQSADAHVEGLPLLANAQASILCKIASASQVGTHTLFVAEVADVIYISDCNPLVYCDGNYGMVSSLPKTAEQMNRLGLMTAVA